jgi:hypothetical protein
MKGKYMENQQLVTGNYVSSIESIVRELIPDALYGKMKKELNKYHADLEGNVRLFLDHLGIEKARDLDEPIEDIYKRMDLLNIHIVHMRVDTQPELNGFWICKRTSPDTSKPLVCFTDPRLVEGRFIILKKIMLDKSVYNVQA